MMEKQPSVQASHASGNHGRLALLPITFDLVYSLLLGLLIL
jgi:hypothetical protein